MTDEPTKNPSDQPTDPVDQPTQPTPPPPPSEPSGVGFAAINLPGQQPSSQPMGGQAPGYANPYQPPTTPPQAASPTPPPPGPSAPGPSAPPPGPVYQYDYSRIPVTRASGPSVVLVAGLAFIVVLALGVGALYALGVGPFARTPPTPRPTLIAQPTPTAGPVTPEPSGVIASPAPSPSGVVPSATPIGDPEEALRSHIPAAILDTCFVSSPDDPGAILALAVCDADDGDIRVTYFQYASYDKMFSAYSGFRLASQIEPDSGDCDDPATWPTENSYDIGEITAGRLLCTEELGETALYWTDDRLNILSQAVHTNGDHERLIEFWESESGPDL
jgi:hypothetical protein